MTSLPDLYAARVADGSLSADTAQQSALASLERIRAALAEPVRKGLFRKAPPPPKGLYLWGGVGRGKSMLMDMFVDACPVPVRRVHFHAFMQEIHSAMHTARANGVEDALKPVATQVIADIRVLAFDEMQITDITDAMIVGRLFEMLFAGGVVVVTTSNRVPDDLYKDGLNRQLFLPFIDLLKEQMEVLELASPTDYRQNRLEGAQVYFTPITAESRTAMSAIWTDLTQGQSAPLDLVVKSRKVTLPGFHNGVGRATFLAKPEMLYVEGTGTFEFERTASRLREMQSADWGQSER